MEQLLSFKPRSSIIFSVNGGEGKGTTSGRYRMGRGGRAIGIDVGGTAVKGGVVDLRTGQLRGPVVRLPTPDPARIADVVPVIAAVARTLASSQPGAQLPLGIALSGDVRDGRHTTGVNLHDSWVGAPARDLLEAATGRPLVILNDADAAGLGEAACGAAAGVAGVVVVLTFGTGIGSAILLDGRLLPNSGFGQLPFHGRPVELLISAVARERRGLSWRRWAADVSDYLAIVDELLRPERIVMGGGVIAARDAFWQLLRPTCEVVPAALGNAAGIVGAARFAANPPEGDVGSGR
jgi:polyphosphate glucokinase